MITGKKDKPLHEDAVDVEMQHDMLLILSSLCEMDVHRKVHRHFYT